MRRFRPRLMRRTRKSTRQRVKSELHFIFVSLLLGGLPPGQRIKVTELCVRDMMASKEAQEKTKRMGEALGLVPASNRK